MTSRCDHCKKKMGLLGFTCNKCTMKLCASHIQCELHNCPHDHRRSGQEMMKKQMETIKKLETKLVRIEDN
jgi:predicted nucleic acid binding AN1-type Zn finger protein